MINHTITVRNRRIKVDTPRLIQGCAGSDSIILDLDDEWTGLDEIPVSEVPQNGTPAYFPMQDGSSILAKSWQPDGTIATVRYIPEVTESI